MPLSVVLWFGPLALGCKGKDDGWACDGGGTVEVCNNSAVSSEEGFAQVDIDVGDERSFLLTGVVDGDGKVAVEQVFDPGGREVLDWYDWLLGEHQHESLTYAFWEDFDTVFNWPIRDVDGELEKGTYSVVLGTYTNGDYAEYKKEVALDLTLHRNHAQSVSGGVVNALVVYANGLDQDPVVTDGTEAAIEIWKNVWGAFGLTLEVEFQSSSIDPALPWPGFGDTDQVEAAASAGDGTQIVVIVGETIDGSTDYLGVSGNIPGTLVPTGRTGVVVSWLANAGIDAAFDDEEIRIYGETLAHEVGHYVGMFHPVEDGFTFYDALDDTEQCFSANECEKNLGENLMFPWPVCDFNSCITQDELSSQQQGVMHRYSGIY